jgi:hypothetical protein
MAQNIILTIAEGAIKLLSPSEQCKEAGLKSLAEVSSITGVSVQTLINWHKDKPKLFDVVIVGCVYMKKL